MMIDLDALIESLSTADRVELHRKLAAHRDVAVISETERALVASGLLASAVGEWRTRTGLGLIEARDAFRAAGLWTIGERRSE